MTERPGVSATAGALLGLLTEGARTGWELVDIARERVGSFWTIQRSQVYRELDRLERDGYVVALAEQERRRRPFRITDEGRSVYLDWVQQVPADENVRIPFLLTVAFQDDVPPERFETLRDDQRRRHRERLDQYEELWDALPGEERGSARRATLALGIGYERAALDWLERLPDYLGDCENP